MADDREQAISAITASARQARKPTPRWVWWLAAAVGVGCAVAFAVVLLATGDSTGVPAGNAPAHTGPGFGAGIVIGLVAGVAIGVAITRHRAVNSSRNNP